MTKAARLEKIENLEIARQDRINRIFIITQKFDRDEKANATRKARITELEAELNEICNKLEKLY